MYSKNYIWENLLWKYFDENNTSSWKLDKGLGTRPESYNKWIKIDSQTWGGVDITKL